MASPSHNLGMFKLLEGGLRDGGWMGEGRPKGGHALAMPPRLTHYNIFASPLFAAVALDFLDSDWRAAVSFARRSFGDEAVVGSVAR